MPAFELADRHRAGVDAAHDLIGKTLIGSSRAQFSTRSASCFFQLSARVLDLQERKRGAVMEEEGERIFCDSITKCTRCNLSACEFYRNYETAVH